MTVFFFTPVPLAGRNRVFCLSVRALYIRSSIFGGFDAFDKRHHSVDCLRISRFELQWFPKPLVSESVGDPVGI